MREKATSCAAAAVARSVQSPTSYDVAVDTDADSLALRAVVTAISWAELTIPSRHVQLVNSLGNPFSTCFDKIYFCILQRLVPINFIYTFINLHWPLALLIICLDKLKN